MHQNDYYFTRYRPEDPEPEPPSKRAWVLAVLGLLLGSAAAVWSYYLYG